MTGLFLSNIGSRGQVDKFLRMSTGTQVKISEHLSDILDRLLKLSHVALCHKSDVREPGKYRFPDEEITEGSYLRGCLCEKFNRMSR